MNIVVAFLFALFSAFIVWYKCASAFRDEYEDFVCVVILEGIDVCVV